MECLWQERELIEFDPCFLTQPAKGGGACTVEKIILLVCIENMTHDMVDQMTYMLCILCVMTAGVGALLLIPWMLALWYR